MRRIGILFLSLGWCLGILAQEIICPVLDAEPYQQAIEACVDMEIGEWCYANPAVIADANPDFASPSDIVAIETISQIETLNGANIYGIALAQIEAYQPNSWETTSVSLALIGESTLIDTSNENRTVEIVATEITHVQGANVRSGADSAFRLITSLPQGAEVRVIGRDTANSWVQIALEDGTIGWIVSGSLSVDTSDIPVANDDIEILNLYPAFTSFQLNNLIFAPDCSPDYANGLLLQTEQNGLASLQINSVEVVATGTIWIQADDLTMTISVLEGSLFINDNEIAASQQVTFLADNTNYSLNSYDSRQFVSVPLELLPRVPYITVDVRALITPAPLTDRSPIRTLLLDDPCTVTVGDGGANLRAGPATTYPIQGVLAFRETVRPIAKVTGQDGYIWWQIMPSLWLSAQTTVWGGDCPNIPFVEELPTQPTPQSN